ncbi:uncharacterized protein NDAI_0D00660 [Naumovozyma dairenensis CBS 421]|uniref:Uncharacterized protein n=1 Tax=Naumovozyma dairenensis (strain ATCC 10597 / BCRC 20456 / CBS 421 / NBRC 0211 / NRRL Y-12639) TaxID=1071378 RepID=G0W9B9_NAUDC|nr:hypothetical protein NDAI_0D00660 [Naumovozyma dairenensis CBS 421]CCD24380.1 hypothetical protein NDAI_0D00660 [Naumovozyma dairenensis CBS 421]
MYEQSTPKNVPFMHAPYPYHYYGMPPPQGYYYPYPAMNHNMAPPSHMSAPPSPHVYSQPMYNNHLPIPQTFSQPPLQPIVNHYRDVPHALNPQNPSPLYPISSTGEFSNWIRTLMDHLKSAQYGDLIPNKHGVAARTPSHWEELGLQWLFSTYVKKDFYPKWVKQAQEASVPLFTILQRAMTLAMQATDITIIMRKLRDLHFEGKEPAFIFNANVQSIISQIDTKELTQYEPLIKDCILNALAGPYSTINKEFRTSQSPYSISDIYTRISAEYDYITTTQSARPKCSYCHIVGHTRDQCFKAVAPSTTNPIPKPKSNTRTTRSSPTHRKQSAKSSKITNNITVDRTTEHDHYWT